MGTKGIYGFRKNGVDKLTYNNMDSYPSALGEQIVNFCMETSLEELNNIFDRIIMVDENNKPTQEEYKICTNHIKLPIYDPDTLWRTTLRKVEGYIYVYKNGLPYMLDHIRFINDSLFCEYGYIINLDDKVLEFWRGGQSKKPQEENRYGIEKNDDGYYPCKLVISFPLNNLSHNIIEIMKEKSGD